MAKPVLLADLGGTNARFALLEGGRIGAFAVLPVTEYDGPVAAARAYLAGVAKGRKPAAAAFAASGPLIRGRIVMTNAGWTVDSAALRRALDLKAIRVVNDFAALAWSIPDLTRRDLRRVGGGARTAGAPIAVIGPGTGFGVAALARLAGRDGVLVTEGGHATLAAANRREDAVIEMLRERHGHVSVERALSGAGLVELYRAAASVDGVKAPARDAPGIVAHALAGDCAASRNALLLFCAFLGGVAGDIALTLGARGGLYIGGGMVPRFVDFLARSAFRQRLEAKGRLSAYVSAIPTAVIVNPQPAMLGLRRMLRDTP